MQPEAYTEMAAVEATHWWFRARRRILADTILRLGLPASARILEVGCGTGGNLPMLAGFGDVHAFEMDDIARGIAVRKTTGHYDIRAGQCPDRIPFADERFDLIGMFDVLEHIEQDTGTLIALRQLLTPNGRLLITVPAFPWMYGPHDAFMHHKRRYTVRELRRKIAAAGLVATRLSYFNTLLFPLAALARLKDKLLRSTFSTGTSVPGRHVNAFFHGVFASERHLLRRLDLPFGVSLLCVLQARD